MTTIVTSTIVAFVLIFAFCDLVVSENIHVSVKNKLGDGKSLQVHCQSNDNDLGPQTLTEGAEYGWDFSPNAWGSTLFYCDVSWEDVNGFHFDAYSFHRDWHRCQSQCLWLVSKEGMYAMNGVTGFWEYMYIWPK